MQIPIITWIDINIWDPCSREDAACFKPDCQVRLETDDKSCDIEVCIGIFLVEIDQSCRLGDIVFIATASFYRGFDINIGFLIAIITKTKIIDANFRICRMHAVKAEIISLTFKPLTDNLFYDSPDSATFCSLSLTVRHNSGVCDGDISYIPN